jgi:ring-1,2-phenylacetyl-CoA epoxidase subunit PaaD
VVSAVAVGGASQAPARELREAVAAVVDPEIRVVTIDELGILRAVEIAADGAVVVTIMPTYSGCPAMDAIREDIVAAARGAGAGEVEVRTVFAPAWSTDMISEVGREKLRAAGIAPPPVGGGADGRRTLPLLDTGVTARPPCPRCGSPATEEISRFGSTACRSLWRCGGCREPFDHIKAF